ncbi:Uncharacterised protein [uncultured archaeon]|nr:Uncharacterised protein [uncultured archaeon]
MKIFFDGEWYTYNAKTGTVEKDNFFFFETAQGLYPFEVMQDLNNRKEEAAKK